VYVIYLEIADSVGIGLGPSIGSFVYSFIGYEGTLYFFAALNIILLIVIATLIDSSINKC